MRALLIVGAGCLIAGFSSAWAIQALRWSESDAMAASDADKAIAANVYAVNQHLIESRAETEKYRAEYLEYQKNANAEIDALQHRAASSGGVRVKANCPAVPAAGADASRTSAGTAELDATATRAYFNLERGLAEQYGLLQLCRQELRKRSAQKAP